MDKLKQLDDLELNEELDKKMEIMELCIAGSRLDDSENIGLYWIFNEVSAIVDELKLRLKK